MKARTADASGLVLSRFVAAFELTTRGVLVCPSFAKKVHKKRIVNLGVKLLGKYDLHYGVPIWVHFTLAIGNPPYIAFGSQIVTD